jgi:hypothetical protein
VYVAISFLAIDLHVLDMTAKVSKVCTIKKNMHVSSRLLIVNHGCYIMFLPFQWIIDMGRQSLQSLTGQNSHQTVCINILIMNAFNLSSTSSHIQNPLRFSTKIYL